MVLSGIFRYHTSLTWANLLSDTIHWTILPLLFHVFFFSIHKSSAGQDSDVLPVTCSLSFDILAWYYVPSLQVHIQDLSFTNTQAQYFQPMHGANFSLIGLATADKICLSCYFNRQNEQLVAASERLLLSEIKDPLFQKLETRVINLPQFSLKSYCA